MSEFAGAACPFSNPSFGRRSLKQADPAANPGLQFGFYASSCPNLDTIVATTITNYTAQNVFTPGKLLRLFFHDCAVQGCDASILLDSTPPGSAEKDAPISATLDMFYVVDAIKANVEAQCPGVVSCADILALAAVHSVAIVILIFMIISSILSFSEIFCVQKLVSELASAQKFLVQA